MKTLKETWEQFAKEALNASPDEINVSVNKSSYYVGALATYQMIYESVVESDAADKFVESLVVIRKELEAYKDEGLAYMKERAAKESTKETADLSKKISGIANLN